MAAAPDPSRDTARESERDFLARYDASRFPHPSVAVDVALVTVSGGHLRVLVVRREEHPFLGRWSLPGKFVSMQESLDSAAASALAFKAGLDGIFLEQLYTFGDPQRDPRTRVISVAYYALVDESRLVESVQAGNGACLACLEVPWKGETGGPALLFADGPSDDRDQPLPLAFDHADILGLVVKRLRGKLAYASLGFELLPPRFTLRQLQEIHEVILGRRLNKDSFRRTMLASGQVVATGQREAEVGHRPAELYRFKRVRKTSRA